MYQMIEANGYRIGNRGTVLGKRGKPLAHCVDSGGYVQVHMVLNGERKAMLLHRIVADKWCPKRTGCDVVNHIDGNKLNNAASNLEWVTQSENVLHRYGHEDYIGHKMQGRYSEPARQRNLEYMRKYQQARRDRLKAKT